MPARLTNDERIELRLVGAALTDVKQAAAKAKQRERRAREGREDGHKYSERLSSMFDSATGRTVLHYAVTAAEKESQMYLRVLFPELYLWSANGVESKGISPAAISWLIGEIGDPRWAILHDTIPNPGYDQDEPTSADNPTTIQVPRLPGQPRSFGRLCSYAGIGDIERKNVLRRHPPGESVPQSEVLAAGRPMARTILHMIAIGIRNAGRGGLYRDHYDAEKRKTADRVHTIPCQQCAGKGKDAAKVMGKPWRDGHKDAHALRLLAKTVLLDLWLVAGGEAAQYGTGEPVLFFPQDPLPSKAPRLTKIEREAIDAAMALVQV